jgi:hypothetical protein
MTAVLIRSDARPVGVALHQLDWQKFGNIHAGAVL